MPSFEMANIDWCLAFREPPGVKVFEKPWLAAFCCCGGPAYLEPDLLRAWFVGLNGSE